MKKPKIKKTTKSQTVKLTLKEYKAFWKKQLKKSGDETNRN